MSLWDLTYLFYTCNFIKLNHFEWMQLCACLQFTLGLTVRTVGDDEIAINLSVLIITPRDFVWFKMVLQGREVILLFSLSPLVNIYLLEARAVKRNFCHVEVLGEMRFRKLLHAVLKQRWGWIINDSKQVKQIRQRHSLDFRKYVNQTVFSWVVLTKIFGTADEVLPIYVDHYFFDKQEPGTSFLVKCRNKDG